MTITYTPVKKKTNGDLIIPNKMRCKFSRWVKVISFLPLLLFGDPLFARAAEYEVQGEIVTSYVGRQKHAETPAIAPFKTSAKFIIAVKNSDWLLRIHPQLLADQQNPDAENGGELPPDAEIAPVGDGNVLTWTFKRKQSFEGRSLVIQRKVPCFGFVLEASYIWFVYASSGWLDSQSNSTKLERINYLGGPLYLPGDAAMIWDAKYSRSSENPRLPETATWLYMDRPNLVYSVIAWEEVNGLKVPKDCTFKIYGDNGKSGIVETHQISVQNVVFSKDITLPLVGHPAYPKESALQVFDYRFASDKTSSIPVVNYFVTNTWYSKEEIVKMPGFKRLQVSAARQAQAATPARTPTLVLGALILITLIPIFAVLRKISKNKLQTKG